MIGDGSVVPARHDGMAAFPGPDGRTILVRNHEINGNTGPSGGTDLVLGLPSSPTYDPIAKAGTVTVDVDGQGMVASAYVSLRVADDLRRRSDAVGFVAGLRGDGQRCRGRA